MLVSSVQHSDSSFFRFVQGLRKMNLLFHGRSTFHLGAPLAWKIPWREEPGGLQSMGSLESGTTERPHFHFSLSCIGEGNGNPLQCSCLEIPGTGEPGGLPSMGSQSQTRLK